MLGAYALRVARHGRPAMPRLGASPGSALLPGPVVEAFYWSFHAPARALVRLGVSPDTLTYLSLALSLACAPLLAIGRFRAGAALLIAGAVLDALDGMVAREGGKASRAGAVLDSCLDRVSDAAPLIGLAVFYRGHAVALALPLVAMVASSLVSYARAKADVYRIALPNGLMRRHERLAYLVAALVFGPAVPTTPLTGALPFPITLACLALVASVGLAAGLRLMQRTRAALATADAAELHGPRTTARPEGERRRLLGSGKATSAPL
ncbi:CDP-alcohol phosphatidyltransferase family protein [Sorangium sp. So ce887]|uniref:CDP-alcohol phosphatidyltransferase family protein n=1 Tax=Sorangium sp. So ce887 TaxID=3133324 RepID=UPI003F64581D